MSYAKKTLNIVSTNALRADPYDRRQTNARTRRPLRLLTNERLNERLQPLANERTNGTLNAVTTNVRRG